MEYLLDTCVIIDMINTPDVLDRTSVLIINNETLNVSYESIREIAILNNKNKISPKINLKLLSSYFAAFNIHVLPVDINTLYQYSNSTWSYKDHKDPSDHIIITQAIINNLTLISSDTKFSNYIKSGLSFIKLNKQTHKTYSDIETNTSPIV